MAERQLIDLTLFCLVLFHFGGKMFKRMVVTLRMIMRYFRMLSLFNGLLLSANVAAMPVTGYQLLIKPIAKRDARESAPIHHGSSMLPVVLAYLRPKNVFSV